MRTPVLIFPVKCQILRTCGEGGGVKMAKLWMALCNSSCKNINICLLTASIGDIIVQTIQTKMPICVSYITHTMPIMGGGWLVGPASFL